MKKIFTVLFLSFFAIGLFAQTTKKPVIIKKTATWCPFCGQYGWTFMEDLVDDISDDEAVILGVHFSGDLQSQVSVDLMNNIGGPGQPRFYLNNENQGITSGNITAKLQEVKDQVAVINSQTPDFQLNNFSAYKLQDEAGVIASIEIEPTISDFNMDYYIGLYLVEDDVMNTQSAQSGIVAHPQVLRASLNGESFGEKFIGSGETWVGEAFTYEYTLSNNQYITDDYLDQTFDIAAIIYSFDGNNYVIEQADIISNISVLSSADEVNWVEEPQLIQEGTQQLIFNATPLNDTDNGQVNIYDLQGSMVYSQDIQLISGTPANITVDISQLPAAAYIFNINSSEGIWSKQFIISK